MIFFFVFLRKINKRVKSIFNFQVSNILVCFVFLLSSGVHAQRRDYNFRFDARVMDADTAMAISHCHIINKTQNKGTISDVYGSFTITANVGDSIVFSSIGYGRLTIAVNDSMYTNDRIIMLKQEAYTLTELDIGLFSTYDRFRREILSMEAQKAYDMAFDGGMYDLYTPPLPNQGGINIPLPATFASPITFLYNLWSVEGKQYRHFLSVINGTAEFIIIGEKFNGFIVRELTGFENDELVKFMSFCNFTKKYLLAASEMEIRRAIMRKYREYIE